MASPTVCLNAGWPLWCWSSRGPGRQDAAFPVAGTAGQDPGGWCVHFWRQVVNPRTDTAVSSDLHPWVRRTQASLERAKPGLYDVLLHAGLSRLNIWVSKGAIDRSMSLWDTLLKQME